MILMLIHEFLCRPIDDDGYHIEDCSKLLLEILEYKIDIIETESQQDLWVACRKMLRKWLSSARGRSPKIWRTLFYTSISYLI